MATSEYLCECFTYNPNGLTGGPSISARSIPLPKRTWRGGRMPYISKTHKSYYGTYAGNQHCVALVRQCTGLGHTSTWRAGEAVRGSGATSGTAIATFDPDGSYGNHTDGRSHAAILLAENSDGLLCADQWSGQVAHERVIRFRNGSGDAVNDGDQFRIIET